MYDLVLTIAKRLQRYKKKSNNHDSYIIVVIVYLLTVLT